MRLIDADVLMEKLSRMIDYCQKDSKVNGLTALFQVGDAIMDCKSVDAVEAVRCKDCKYYKQESRGYYSRCQVFNGAYEYGFPTEEDDFCSYGEKREH